MEAPILWRAQNSSISRISLRPPVFEVVMLCIVKPIVKTSTVMGGHMPTKHMVPRGRSRVKNLVKSTVSCGSASAHDRAE